MKHTILLALAVWIAACGHDQPQLPGPTVLPNAPSLFLRVTPDADASSMIGAFVPDDVPDASIDETKIRVTRCSKFITPATLPASGRVKEIAAASQAASANLGVQGIGKFDIGGSRGNAMLVYYDLQEKMQGKVDADGLGRCCADAPQECSKRYISSAVMGTGGYYAATESANSGGLDAAIPADLPIDVGVVYQDSMKWERRAQFKRQYFAFSFQHTGGGPPSVTTNAGGCEWANNVPTDLDGTYFVGVSNPMPTEKLAREDAMRDAREQVVHYLGEWLAESTASTRKITGSAADLTATFDDTTTKQALSQGLARMVKDRKWCGPELSATPSGEKSTMKALAFFPTSERAQASRVALQSLIDLKKRNGDNTKSLEDALAALPK